MAMGMLSFRPLSFILGVIVVHTASLLIVAGMLAMVFYQAYDRYGLRLLQRAWFNFDLVWALALFVAAAAALLI